MKIVAVLQARMGSVRLPNKVLRPIGGVPMIELMLNRLARAKQLDEIVVATSVHPNNEPLAAHVGKLGYQCYLGSEEDVLDRYVQAARLAGADVVVRVTGDCPLIDPDLLDQVVTNFKEGGYDYYSNNLDPTFPDGLDAEVFKMSALERAHAETSRQYDREHVTPYLRQGPGYERGGLRNDVDLSGLRWTVDEAADFAVVERVFAHFAPRSDFSWNDVLALHHAHPEIFRDNEHLHRNEGAAMNRGQKLWKRAKHVIPGGNMLLSKRAEMFLPGQWPAYFSKAKGCTVWDLDGKPYIDMSIMGIGTNTLGYGHPDVDAAVQNTVVAGNMSTLNCPEEVYLAERLVEIHPWAGMARFARTGGEANAIAVRIARAATGRNGVAVCGYHGWHDWYLAANLGSDGNLAGHLLPGLEPRGVPSNLRGTVFTFNYNDYAALEALVNKESIGVIVMEVIRNHEPQDGFLQKVRQLATQRGIVLVFDECTSGFRQTFGGLHKLYDVEPDMAMFGKAIGNGYALTATIGRREIMEAAQSTFISSTFWTERIGPAASLATLDVMERLQSWDKITNIGRDIRQRWQQLADKHGLSLDHWGIPALAGYTIKSKQALEYKTFITQEMLAKGYLASNTVYACTEHTSAIVDGYFEALDPLFGVVRECEDGRDINALLKGPVCHAGFKRLN